MSVPAMNESVFFAVSVGYKTGNYQQDASQNIETEQDESHGGSPLLHAQHQKPRRQVRQTNSSSRNGEQPNTRGRNPEERVSKPCHDLGKSREDRKSCNANKIPRTARERLVAIWVGGHDRVSLLLLR